MTEPRFIVGVDLGTTHCVVAESPLDRVAVELFAIPQLVAPGEVASRELLPSFLYLPSKDELPPHALALPWGKPAYIVGTLARNLGAAVPNRLVASAKSWICHGGVNRRAPILPWSAPDNEPHVSPFEATVHYLAHLKAAWESAHPNLSMADQDVVVTVPASFDDGARELTTAAADRAGLGDIRLLEEPQAAFYDFIGTHRDDLGEILGEARLLLVIDIGGGTTDLTLLKVLPRDRWQAGRPELERIAVGGHLMLGGDNMDTALAHHVVKKAGLENRLDPTEWAALVSSARLAKEKLLEPDAPDVTMVTIQRRGSRLMRGTRSMPLGRDEVRRLLVDGFFPLVGPDEVAVRTGRPGLTTLGLPYVADPAVPKHVCTFLRRHEKAALEAGARVVGGLPRPDLVLLNGGVFNAGAMRDRLTTVLAQWYGSPVPLLEHTSLDTAVAHGAVYSGLARRGLGTVISGGTARAYYIGVEGPEGEAYAFCAAPKGMNEGSTVEVPQRIFELVLDRRVAFPLFSYIGDRNDPAGTVVKANDESQLEALPPLETVLRSQGERLRTGASGGVPVRISTSVNDQGTLEIFLMTVQLPPHRWRLEFVLGADGPDSSGLPSAQDLSSEIEPPLPEGFEEASFHLQGAFAEDHDGIGAARQLRRDLEDVLGLRGEWSATLCRALWDVCNDHSAGRRHSPIHELNWLRIAGWSLRPGLGVAGDAARMSRLWQLYRDSLFHPSKANWAEWWIMWRRVAAGLDRAQQETIYEDLRPWLAPDIPPPQGPRVFGDVEMFRLLGAMERLPRGKKEAAGAWFLERNDQTGKMGSWWPLGRLGARIPFHGSAGDVVSRSVAETWIERLLSLDWSQADGAAFASVMLARATGDPARDIRSDLRQSVAARLKETKEPETWVEMVTQATGMSDSDTGRLFGDTLPVGLKLV